MRTSLIALAGGLLMANLVGCQCSCNSVPQMPIGDSLSMGGTQIMWGSSDPGGGCSGGGCSAYGAGGYAMEGGCGIESCGGGYGGGCSPLGGAGYAIKGGCGIGSCGGGCSGGCSSFGGAGYAMEGGCGIESAGECSCASCRGGGGAHCHRAAALWRGHCDQCGPGRCGCGRQFAMEGGCGIESCGGGYGGGCSYGEAYGGLGSGDCGCATGGGRGQMADVVNARVIGRGSGGVNRLASAFGGCAACGGNGCAACGGGLIGVADQVKQAAASRVAANPHMAQFLEKTARRCENGYCGGGSGPMQGAVTYPYYTTRGPRDFFESNPPSIGP